MEAVLKRDRGGCRCFGWRKRLAASGEGNHVIGRLRGRPTVVDVALRLLLVAGGCGRYRIQHVWKRDRIVDVKRARIWFDGRERLGKIFAEYSEGNEEIALFIRGLASLFEAG